MSHDENSNGLIRLAGHHLGNFKDYYFGEDEALSKYGKNFVTKTRELYLRMLANPRLRILIDNGGDDICKNCFYVDDAGADCNIYFEELGMKDEQTASKLGFELGKECAVSDIIKAFNASKGREVNTN